MLIGIGDLLCVKWKFKSYDLWYVCCGLFYNGLVL